MRSLIYRILVALVGIPLLILAVKSGPWTRAGLIVLLQALILREWIILAKAKDVRFALAGTILAAAGLDAAVFSSGMPLGMAAAVIGITALFVIEVLRGSRQPLVNLGASALFLLYVVVPLSLWFGMEGVERFQPAGALVTLWASVWLCDTFAYFGGMSFGRYKLYPAASPNKTIEGVIGGIVGAASAPLLLLWFHGASPSIRDVVALTIAVGLVGQTGDLLESLMKREVQIKDTSALLPGHGGLLDRFDSLLLATPAFCAYLIVTGL